MALARSTRAFSCFSGFSNPRGVHRAITQDQRLVGSTAAAIDTVFENIWI